MIPLPPQKSTLHQAPLLLLLALCTPLHAQSPSVPTPARLRSRRRVTLEEGFGFTLPNGAAHQTSGTGFNFVIGFGYQATSRLALVFRTTLSQTSVTSEVLRQGNEPGGHINLPTFTFQPEFTCARIGVWKGYVTAGAGLSLKETAFTDPNYTDGDGNPIVIASASTAQPIYTFGTGISRYIGHDRLAALYAEADFQQFLNPPAAYPGLAPAGTSLIPVTFGLRW